MNDEVLVNILIGCACGVTTVGECAIVCMHQIAYAKRLTYLLAQRTCQVHTKYGYNMQIDWQMIE